MCVLLAFFDDVDAYLEEENADADEEFIPFTLTVCLYTYPQPFFQDEK